MNDITTSDRNAFHQNTGYVEEKHKSDSATTVNIAKVFLYMFIGLAITTIVSFGVGAGVYYGILNNMEDGTIPTIYFASLIFSAVALFVDMIIINFVVVRGKHSILVPGIIYAVLVGVLFSMLTIVIDWRIIGMAFGITALSFLVMSLISFLSKGNLSAFLVIAFGLIIGAGLLSLFNFILSLAGVVIPYFYWIVEFAIFGFILFVTMFDLWRVKKIAEQGQMTNNVSLYCAFILYTDFINIFVRVLYFLLLIFGRSNR